MVFIAMICTKNFWENMFCHFFQPPFNPSKSKAKKVGFQVPKSCLDQVILLHPIYPTSRVKSKP